MYLAQCIGMVKLGGVKDVYLTTNEDNKWFYILSGFDEVPQDVLQDEAFAPLQQHLHYDPKMTPEELLVMHTNSLLQHVQYHLKDKRVFQWKQIINAIKKNPLDAQELRRYVMKQNDEHSSDNLMEYKKLQWEKCLSTIVAQVKS